MSIWNTATRLCETRPTRRSYCRQRQAVPGGEEGHQERHQRYLVDRVQGLVRGLSSLRQFQGRVALLIGSCTLTTGTRVSLSHCLRIRIQASAHSRAQSLATRDIGTECSRSSASNISSHISRASVGVVTLGTKVLRGVRMFLLYISAQMSKPPSIHRFLQDSRQRYGKGVMQLNDRTYRKEPAASTTTSSSLSDNRVINAPTIFLPCSKRLVEGSFWMRLDTATHAHLRSAGSTLSI